MEECDHVGVTGVPGDDGSDELVMRTPLRERSNDLPPRTPSSVGSKTPSTGSSRKPPRTPHSQSYADVNCAVCLSPLNTVRGASSGRPDPNGEVRESFVTPCNHCFHICCLQSCRASNLTGCPLCREPLPAGLTPPMVRELRASVAAQEATQSQLREMMVSRAAAAREAVRAQMRAAQQRAQERAQEEGTAVTPQTPDVPASSQVTLGVNASDAALFPSPFRSALEMVSQADTSDALLGPDTEMAEGGDSVGGPWGAAPQDCHHCRITCEAPGKCVECGELFCGLCAMIDYELPEERMFCLDCVFDQRDQRRASNVTVTDVYQQQQPATSIAVEV